MKTNYKHEVIARIAGPGLVLATLLAMVLSSSGVGRAQASATSPAVPAATPAKAAPAAQATQPAPPSERQPKGAHEGITVHGHWTIEVRNPDGKLVSHTEFENGLSTNSGGGATLLASFLGRVLSPGSWSVLLGPGYLQNPTIYISEPNSAAFTLCSNLLNPTDVCFPNLAISVPILTNGVYAGNTLTFQGTGTVPQGFPSTIGYVETDNLICLPSVSPQACFSGQSGNSNYSLTARTLNGAAGTSTAPVSVTAGQTVSVTVVVSFASGS
jgi:hypothetical protein